MNNDESHINTYPVGFLEHLHKIRRIVEHSMFGYLRYQVQQRNWRAVRNYFNGYLAEWHYRPEGVACHKAGRGWTRRSALRRLGNHIARANAPETNTRNRRG